MQIISFVAGGNITGTSGRHSAAGCCAARVEPHQYNLAYTVYIIYKTYLDCSLLNFFLKSFYFIS